MNSTGDVASEIAGEKAGTEISLPRRPLQAGQKTAGARLLRKRVAPKVTPGKGRRSRPGEAPVGRARPVGGASGDVASSVDVDVSGRGEATPTSEPSREDGTISERSEVMRLGVSESDRDQLPTHTSDTVSGVVRSSLDLICQPPTDIATETSTQIAQDRASIECFNDDMSRGQVDRATVLESVSETSNSTGGREVGEGRGGEERGGTPSDDTSGGGGRAGAKRKGSESSDPDPSSKRKRARNSTPPAPSSAPRPPRVKEAPNRSKMTMQQLTYYNPSANPMKSTVEAKSRRQEQKEKGSEGNSKNEGSLPSQSRESSVAREGEEEEEEEEEEGRIVPKLRLGADGCIVIDEQSMLVETTKKPSLEGSGDVVYETPNYTTSNSFRKSYTVCKWTKEETSQFFKALSQVGTDFTMMTLLLPRRSRRELKNKFKREEKHSPYLVNQALKGQITQ